MEHFKNLQSEVIICQTVWPRGVFPTGWSEISGKCYSCVFFQPDGQRSPASVTAVYFFRPDGQRSPASATDTAILIPGAVSVSGILFFL